MSETALSPRSLFDDDDLGSITSFEDAARTLADAGVAAESFDSYGNGFKVVAKDTLEGIDMILIEWRFNPGSFRDEDGNLRDFVSVMAVTKHNEKVIFNDGGAGVCRQLLDVTNKRLDRGHKHPQAGLVVAGGLVASHYERDNGDPATTWYLAE